MVLRNFWKFGLLGVMVCWMNCFSFVLLCNLSIRVMLMDWLDGVMFMFMCCGVLVVWVLSEVLVSRSVSVVVRVVWWNVVSMCGFF